MLNKQKGDMYGFVTHTWNPIRGKCPHNCPYCYMISFWKIMKSEKQELVDKELKAELGEDKFIFVGSSTDMFAKDVPDSWIKEVLRQCNAYPKNKYLFQSKNPLKMFSYEDMMGVGAVLGTTIETNRDTNCDAPNPVERYVEFTRDLAPTHKKMVTIEPIMDFDLDVMVKWFKDMNPTWVNIGADSKGHKLPEPSPEKVKALINELEKFTNVKIKKNLKRIMGDAT